MWFLLPIEVRNNVKSPIRAPKNVFVAAVLVNILRSELFCISLYIFLLVILTHDLCLCVLGLSLEPELPK